MALITLTQKKALLAQKLADAKRGSVSVGAEEYSDLQDAIMAYTAIELTTMYAAWDQAERNAFIFIAGRVLALDSFVSIIECTVLHAVKVEYQERTKEMAARYERNVEPVLKEANAMREQAQQRMDEAQAASYQAMLVLNRNRELEAENARLAQELADAEREIGIARENHRLTKAMLRDEVATFRRRVDHLIDTDE